MSSLYFLSGHAVIGMVEPTRVEPDGTAMNLKDSMSESEWKANVSEWDAWSVAFTESVWPDERKFYFYKKKDPQSVTCVEEYPESCRMAFQVIIPGIGAGSKTSRGKLRITPYGLELIVMNGPGQYPPLLEDKIPMGSVKGWRLLQEGRKICVYVQTSKGLFDVLLKTKNSSRIAECLQCLSRTAHDALQTAPADRPKQYYASPEEYIDHYPFNCAHMDKKMKEEFVDRYGIPLVVGAPFEVPLSKSLGVIFHNPRPKTPICYARSDVFTSQSSVRG